ncbi:MAG: hypothetical protein EHM13_03755 [Acidobacteria bacterium]|nr:MAG: hypothetical protein EHM13_03755 [Acidobacteriota bacterium]
MNSLQNASTLTSHRSSNEEFGDLGSLFHRLNNELGIILSHAELLEVKAMDDISRSRASQVVSSVLDAMGTARSIRSRINQLTNRD